MGQIAREPTVEGVFGGLGERLANLERLLLGDSGWQAPTLGNAWVKVGTPLVGYRRTGNVIRLRGQIKAGENGKTAFTLPATFRPSQQVVCVVATAGPASGVLIIETSGTVTPFFTGTSGKELTYLDSAWFTTD